VFARVYPRFLAWIMAGVLPTSAALAAEDDTQAEIGLKVGEHAPSFSLKDQNGHAVASTDLLKNGPLAVVFHRSAEWCLFCKFELQHLQRNLKKFEAAGGQVVAISYDSPEALRKFADRQSITFSLLSDEKSKTIDAFKVLDRSATDPTNRFSAHVAFVLDQSGVIRDKLIDVIQREEPGIGYLVKAVKEARSVKAGPNQPDKQQTSSRPAEAEPATLNPT
jgi:peroxiredoxin